jgi:hypothetical protein
MKTLKLLNKKNLLISLIFFNLLTSEIYSAEPVDIWNLDTKIVTEKIQEETVKEKSKKNSIYEMQNQKNKKLKIDQDENLISKKLKIVGLYDPADNNLSIDMWSNSNGEKILDIYNKIQKIELSNDAKEILNILLLTNTYYPKRHISVEEFLRLKSDWLIKNNDFELIEEYIIKNQTIDENLELIRFLVDRYLSKSDLKKSCKIFSNILENINDDYLSKFNIYCLINDNKREEAQLLFDLKKELGFEDIFFEKKFNHLMGYQIEKDEQISEKSILEFHLSHLTSSDFKFEPNKSTSKFIWSYLSTSNLLVDIENIDLENREKISIIEKATHDGNYTENELFNLYKRFQFNINQLLTIKQSSKLLPNLDARALIYQGILITTETSKKIELIKILKDSFTKDGIENAYKDELIKNLKEVNTDDVPSNYTSFYYKFINDKKQNLTRIKINNKIIHQSKLINYFKPGASKKNIQKDVNDLLRKIKKDKKYFISTKDIILLESLKSDGILFSKKYENLYKVEDSNMPADIQILIDNNEMGLVLLRLVEVIGQDQLKNIESQSLYFIISALNQLNIDSLRNKILLKVLPLKV